MNAEQFKVLLITSLVAMLTSLLMGKFLKKVFSMILEAVARKTKTKVDDELVRTAEGDWGIETKLIDKETNKKKEEK